GRPLQEGCAGYRCNARRRRGAVNHAFANRPGMASALHRKITGWKKKRERDRSSSSCTVMESDGFCRLMQEVRVEATRVGVPAIAERRSRPQDIHAESGGVFRRLAVEDDWLNRLCRQTVYSFSQT